MNHETSSIERKRRYDALRVAMDESGYDAMLVWRSRRRVHARPDPVRLRRVPVGRAGGFLLLPRGARPSLLADPLGGYSAGRGRAVGRRRPRHAVARGGRACVAASRSRHGRGHDRRRRPRRHCGRCAHPRDRRLALPDSNAWSTQRTCSTTSARSRATRRWRGSRGRWTSYPGCLRGARSGDPARRAGIRRPRRGAPALPAVTAASRALRLMGRPPAPGFGPGQAATRSSETDVIVIDLEWGGPSGILAGAAPLLLVWDQPSGCRSNGLGCSASRRSTRVSGRSGQVPSTNQHLRAHGPRRSTGSTA